MTLVGVWEIAKLAKVSRQAVCNWVSRYNDFPKPLARLAMGNIYDEDEVRKWLIKLRQKRRGFNGPIDL